MNLFREVLMIVPLGLHHEAALKEMVRDFRGHGEAHIPALFVLVEDWDHATRVAKLAAWPEGRELEKGWVPCSTWFWEEDGRLLGNINFRHRLTGTMDRFGGHVGYSVAPSARGQGVAKRMLRHAMAAATERGIKELVLTTNADNIASQRVLLACGGRFDAAYDWEGRPTERYLLPLIGR